MTGSKLMLDYVYEREIRLASTVFLTQPLGGGAVRDYTWQQTMDEARRMAAYLQSLGFDRGDRIAILSKNCAHFFITELAIWMAGLTTVAIFPTENANTVKYVLTHSEAKLLFVGKLDLWATQEPGVDAELPRIAFPLAPKTSTSTSKWDDIVAKTPPIAGSPKRESEDIAMIIYTSGSTGEPKGVMHNFERVTRASEGIVRGVEITENERVLSYLPLAHVFERAYIECGAFVGGGHVFFAEALDTFVADLNRARPTMFLSVPRLWLKFQHGVFAKMPAKKLDFLLKIPVVRGIVAKKVLKGLGLDAVRLAGSGSAPIPAELIAWYRRLGLNLLEGYAMSEDFAFSHLSTETHNAPGYVGAPYPEVSVKISDDGEVLIKSPGQFVGYYKRDDLTAEAFTPDGYFRTGDKGERNAQGLLKLTGRVKELFKTAKGKYVAPAPIENKINESQRIEMSCVSGVGQAAAYGLLVLAEDVRPKLGDAAFKASIQTELEELLKKVNAQLPDYEQLGMFVVTPEPWTIENGLLTPTLKIKRTKVEDSVAAKVDGWYAASKKIIWA